MQFAGIAAAAGAFPALGAALDYPTRPVRIIEGFGSGGTPDVISRLMARWLARRFGQPVVIESKIGGAGNLATQAVIQAPPDGYTLLTCLATNTINETLYRHLDFDFLRDTAPVAGLIRVPMVLLVNPAFPARTFPQFINYARVHPGKVDMASPGIGTPMYIAGALIKMMAGVNIVHVPYRGPARAFTDLLSGRVQSFIITVPAAIGFIRAGQLSALAVTGTTRTKVLPNVPTVDEYLSGFEATAWDGVCAPKRTPAAVVGKLNQAINAGLADPQLKAKITGLGGRVMPMSPAQFGMFLAEETAKWAKVIRFSGATGE